MSSRLILPSAGGSMMVSHIIATFIVTRTYLFWKRPALHRWFWPYFYYFKKSNSVSTDCASVGQSSYLYRTEKRSKEVCSVFDCLQEFWGPLLSNWRLSTCLGPRRLSRSHVVDETRRGHLFVTQATPSWWHCDWQMCPLPTNRCTHWTPE